MKPRLLDLFCGAGGCSVGYARAGFDVVGVDIEPQPNYPFEFIQYDAISYFNGYEARHDFGAIHASPPCLAFSFASMHRPGLQETYPDLIDPTRDLLNATGLPWVIENVVGSPLRKDLLLCGEMFGLRVHRHRYFETGGGFFPFGEPHQKHRLRSARDNCHVEEGRTRMVVGNYRDHEDASEAMGIDWMTRKELRLAIPPAYTEFIGRQLLEAVESKGVALAVRKATPNGDG